ncbi:hypothetical protein, variant 3 [Aphanomyces astaci]|uniref:Uncharacterized protein n=1 Tax=Aphanomyces astaci TaxID=112090 RepID=W4GYE8_APHAT|nr:hypothetical protein, variant 3 [Aphanomyces astaci]ETV84682.1 hypothetical protein, variant 3 [Aphanomyces astaci]|eukprot:XP_009826374.1 hypothetical protein, variant 3 [Aphanomyces astaci]
MMEPKQGAENRTIFQEDGICKKAEGDMWARQGKFDKAIMCYNKACFVNPDDCTLYSARGNAYTKLCDFKSAISNYKKLLSMQSNPPQAIKEEIAEVFNAQGYSYLIEKEYTTAIVYLTDAVALDALQANYWLHRCLAYIGLENWTKALKDIDHAICIDANDADILVLRAKLNWKLKLIDKGNNDIARAFKLNPNHPEVLDFEKKMWYQSQHLHDLACRHIMNREFAKSLDCLNSCIEFNADDVKILVLRASVHRELGDYDAAMADVERASQACFRKQRQSDHPHTSDPDELDEHVQELFDSQSSAFGPPISHIGEHPEITRQRNLILNDIAVAEIQRGHFDAALNAMNMAIASEVATASRFDGRAIDYRFYVNRGDCYRALSKNQAALADYNSALEVQPMDADIHTRVAVIRYHFGLEQFNRGAFDKAEVEFSLALRHNASVYHYYVRRGDCYRYLEQNDLAFQDYKQAQLLNPVDPDVKVRTIVRFAEIWRLASRFENRVDCI